MTSSLVSGPPGSTDSAPRFATPRTLSRKTYGHELSAISARLGQPFMPWQNMVADVAMEVDPATGKLAYRTVILKLPRQAGKTSLTRAVAVHRALAFAKITGLPQNIIYTAQTFNDARKKFYAQAEELEQLIPRRVTLNRNNNNPSLVWSNGSEHRPLSVTPKSGPSASNDLVLVDEAWAHEDGTLEGGLRPTMIARPQPQFWILSNAGKASSYWWKDQWELGQELALAEDVTSGIAYFEWSGDRNDPDFNRADPSYAARHHPATGYTIDAAAFGAELLAFRKNPDEYDRAFLNLEPDEGIESTIDPHLYRATGDDDSVIVGMRTFALDIMLDRSWASVSWAGRNAEDLDHFELIKHERGTRWIIPYLKKKLARNGQDTVAVAAGTPAALLQSALEEAGINVLVLGRAEYATACAEMYDGFVDGTVRHLASEQDPLDAAVKGAAWSTGAVRVWSRIDSTIDISPLVSGTVAKFAHAIALANNYDVMDSVG